MSITLKNNAQHRPAFRRIMRAAPVIRSYSDDNAVYTLSSLMNGAYANDDMLTALDIVWNETTNGRVIVPLCGQWYAKLKIAIDGRYAAFELILCSNDKRRNTCAYTEHYNATGGYWYSSSTELPRAGHSALESALFTSLRSIVSAYNRAAYMRY